MDNLSSIMDIFQGNPVTTRIGIAIDKAVNVQNTEDWSSIMNVCDIVNSLEEGPKDAIRAIRKMFTMYAGADWAIVSNILSVLEALVKNCGRRFHLQLTQKSFLKDLKILIGPRYNPPLAIQEKVLSMIQAWAISFQNNPDFENIQELYKELKNQGIEFPEFDAKASPISVNPTKGCFTNVQQCQDSQSILGTIKSRARQFFYGSKSEDESLNNDTETALSDQIKIHSELAVAAQHWQVLNEMLVALSPGRENPEDFDLLVSLHKTCLEIRNRILDLITNTEGAITDELLRRIDELNQVLFIYEEYMTKRSTAQGYGEEPMSSTQPSYDDTLLDLRD